MEGFKRYVLPDSFVLVYTVAKWLKPHHQDLPFANGNNSTGTFCDLRTWQVHITVKRPGLFWLGLVNTVSIGKHHTSCWRVHKIVAEPFSGYCEACIYCSQRLLWESIAKVNCCVTNRLIVQWSSFKFSLPTLDPWCCSQLTLNTIMRYQWILSTDYGWNIWVCKTCKIMLSIFSAGLAGASMQVYVGGCDKCQTWGGRENKCWDSTHISVHVVCILLTAPYILFTVWLMSTELHVASLFAVWMSLFSLECSLKIT